jgi:hypothetical protein
MRRHKTSHINTSKMLQIYSLVYTSESRKVFQELFFLALGQKAVDVRKGNSREKEWNGGKERG